MLGVHVLILTRWVQGDDVLSGSGVKKPLDPQVWSLASFQEQNTNPTECGLQNRKYWR